MPGLIACGRRWDIGSDDLVFPGIGESVMRLIWLLVISIVFHMHKDSFGCKSGQVVQTYYIGTLVLLCVHILLNFMVVLTSMQGSITDTASRRRMPKLLYIKLGLFLPELAWLVIGSYWAFADYTNCESHIVLTVKVTTILGWVMVLAVLTAFGVIFDPLGSRHHSRTRGDLEEDEDLRIASKRMWENRCRLICCCAACDEQSKDAFNNIAQLFTDFFEGLDLVPTDIAAGLILMQQEQRNQPKTVHLVPIPPSPCRNQTIGHSVTIPVETTDIHPSLQDNVSVSSTAQNGSPARLSLDNSSLDVYPRAKAWMDVEFTCHYMKFAMGSYGWPLFMYTNLFTGCCKLWGYCKCCSCACQEHNSVLDDNCCQCHTSAIVNITGIREEDIIYASFNNRVFEIPFFVALDHQYCCVVVSIRGTLSLRDALTDMTADSERMDVSGVANARAHKGILNAAVYIRNKLESLHLLDNAFQKAQGYGLVITGHSLGAGAACLLSVLLRPHYPQLICYAYSPPGGLLSLPLSRYTEEFVCSVVLGKDMIPRLSLVGMEDLKARVIRVIKDCHKPKYQVLTCGCWEVLSGSPREPDSDQQPLLDESRNSCSIPIYTGSRADMEQTLQDAIVTSNRSRIAHEALYPPGHIMYIEESEPKRNCCGMPTYVAAWARADTFTELVVSPKMVSDHLPDSVMRALEQLAGRNMNPSYLVQLEQHNPIT